VFISFTVHIIMGNNKGGGGGAATSSSGGSATSSKSKDGGFSLRLAEEPTSGGDIMSIMAVVFGLMGLLMKVEGK
jgi:hypothetical protein